MFLGALAQHSVQGRVMLQGQPAEGATLQVSGPVKLQTTTLPNGFFTLNNLPAGSYQLQATYSGYRTVTQSITVGNSNQALEIALEPLPDLLQPVEVTALRAGALAPFTKTNISKAFIEKNNLGQDIPFMLNQTANVVVNSDAGNGIGYTGIRIRGTDATRINMTINGIPYNDPESQGTFFVNLPDFLSSVSSIQVQRGVGTSSNGAGAFGATMNFSTHDYREEAYAELLNSVGSFNTFKHTLRAGTGLINNKFTFDARLSRITSDGFVDRASTNLQGAYLSGAWYLPKGNLRFNAILGKERTYQAWNGIPESALKTNRRFNSAGTARPGEPYDNETDNYWQNHYQLFYNTELSKKWHLNTALYLTTGRGYYEQYRANERLSNYFINSTERTDLIRQLWLNNKMYGQIFNVQHRTQRDELTIGGGWNVYPGDHYGYITQTLNTNALTLPFRWYDMPARKTDINSYVKWQRKVANHWHLFTDLQFRHVNYTASGFRNNPNVTIDEQWNFLNPKAGITYQKNNITAYASYAMANKEPNRDDFEAGLLEKPRREQLHNVELGIERKNLLPGLQVSANAYMMYYRDQLVLTGAINDVGAYARTNIPESYRMGIELEARYVKPKVSGTYSLALSQNRIINYTGFYDDYDNGGQISVNYGNTPIALSPAVVQNATIEWRPVARTEFSLLSKYVGRQYLDNAGQKARSLDPFFVNDIRASYQIPVRNMVKRLRVVLQVNNLFNTMYEPNGYTFSYIAGAQFVSENFFYPMASINYMAAVEIGF